MSTCNRLDLESLGSWPTNFALKASWAPSSSFQVRSACKLLINETESGAAGAEIMEGVSYRGSVVCASLMDLRNAKKTFNDDDQSQNCTAEMAQNPSEMPHHWQQMQPILLPASEIWGPVGFRPPPVRHWAPTINGACTHRNLETDFIQGRQKLKNVSCILISSTAWTYVMTAKEQGE